MYYIVLSKRQVEGSLNINLCKDKTSADSCRKQLFKQNYDVVILSEDDYNKLGNKVFRHRISNINRRNNGGDNINPDTFDFAVSKHKEEHTGEEELYPELTFKQAKDLVGDLSGWGGDEEAHKAWDKEGEGKVIEETFINAFGDDEKEGLAPQCFHEDEDGDEYYLSSNGNCYYLFKKVVTLKGDREQTIYTFGKKEWSKTNDLTLLRFYNIPYNKCVIENKSGYPFLKTDVHNDHDKHLRDTNKKEII